LLFSDGFGEGEKREASGFVIDDGSCLMIGKGKSGIDESAVEEVAGKEYGKEECGMEGELFREDGV
jgi:hypothetical protein